MIQSRFFKTRLILPGFFLFLLTHYSSAQCPTLASSATLTSADCALGSSPCALCPGDVFTLTGSGTGMIPAPGNCINWYYSNTNNFNPYLGEGTLLGCSPITSVTPSSCNPCPTFLGIFVDACGTEENNEFIGLYSGGGFFVDSLSIDYDIANNDGNPENRDIVAGGCGFQVPTAALIATFQNNCPNSSIVGVGPGGTVPPGVPVVVFMSSAENQDYDFSALCSVTGTIYVLQSSCPRSIGAFSNGTSMGDRTTTISLSCGCTSSITYTTTSLVGGNGAYVGNTPLGLFYGNQAGCAFPPFPSVPGGPPPIVATPLNVTVNANMCNGGPYFVVGVYEPLPAGCTPVFTNYIGFDVICPVPVLGADEICDNVNNYDLNQLADPALPGTWAGPGVTGSTFDATGLNGPVSLTYTPTATCGAPNMTIIVVDPTPTAFFGPIAPFCTGNPVDLILNFTGQAPWTFDFFANGIFQSTIVTSNNPVTIPVTPAGSTNYAVVNLQDASMCSGVNTSVLVDPNATPAPTADLQSGSANLCNGQSETITIEFTGTGPFTFEYTENGVLQPAVTTPGPTYDLIVTPNAGTAVHTYTMVSVTANGCTGTVSGTYVVTLVLPPAADLFGDQTVCAGDTAILHIDFSGSGPFIFSYTANGIQQPSIIALTDPFTFIVTPSDTTTYVATGVVMNGCVGMASGQALVTTSLPLTATISGGGQICQAGVGTDISVSFSGPGPYTFTYKANNVLQPSITTNLNPYTFNANPSIGTIYSLASLNNGVCDGIVDGFAIVFVFTPPTAEMTGSQTFCDSAVTNVNVDFTGTGPFTISYSIDGVLQDTINTFDDPYFIPVNTTSTTTYVLTQVMSPGCDGIPMGSATITVNHPPTYAGVLVTCNPVQTDYVVEFDVTSTALPLTLVSGSGTFTGTHFTGNPIAQGVPYSFVFHDTINCSNVTVSGTAVCSCQTDAGTMLVDTIQVCVVDTAVVLHYNNFVSDGNDSLRFILHTNQNVPPGTILAWNTVPQFAFNPPLQTDTLYYISAIAGDPDGSGKIDLNDPCLSVSPGVGVIFRSLPTAVLGPDAVVCVGNQATIPVMLTGTPPYTLEWTLNGIPQSIANIPGPNFQLAFQPLSTSTVILTSVSDSHCSTPLADTAMVTVHVSPQILNVVYTCDLAAGTYVLEFDAVGQQPFNVSGVPGSFSGTHFTSTPVASGPAFNIALTDADNCGQDTASGTPFCVCQTDAGSLSQVPLTLCITDTASIAPSTGFVLEPGDSLYYGLLDPAFNFIAYNDQPVFGFDPLTMMTDSTYTIVAIAGDSIGTGVDMNDPCLSFAIGSDVVWRTPPTATLSGMATVCPGGLASLILQFTGTAPFTATYTANGQSFSTTPTSLNPFSISVNPNVTTNYVLTGITGAGACPGTVSGNATVSVDPPPQILNIQTTCDLANNTVVLQFDVSNGAAPNEVYTISGISGTFSDSVFTSQAVTANQPYTITVSNPTGCSSTVSGITDCQCMTDAGTLNPTPLHACLPGGQVNGIPNNDESLDPDDSLQFVLCQNPATLPAGIFATGNSPVFGIQTGMTAGTTYFIVAVAGNVMTNGAIDWSDPCLSVSPPVSAIFHNPPTATITGDTAICRGNNYAFKIKFQGTAPFTFGYAINGIAQTPITAPQASFNISTNNVQQQQIFTLVSVQDAFCTGTVSGVVTVNVLPDPSGSLLGDVTICKGNSATLTLNLMGANLYDVTLSGGAQPIQLSGIATGATVDVSPSTTTTYTISTLTPIGNACPAIIGPGVTVTVTELNASSTVSQYNGFNLSCADANDGAITLTTSGGIAPINASWSNGATTLSVDNLAAGAYAVVLTDQIGCKFTDAFNLTAPPALDFDITAKSPNCFGDTNGLITVDTITGGTGPYTLTINGLPAQTGGGFPVLLDQLGDGQYTIEVDDANGCTAELQTTITTPPQLTVDLGPDQTMHVGDSTLLDPVISSPAIDSFLWSPQTFMSTPNELSTYVRPERTETYMLSVVDAYGCTASDAVRVLVQKGARVYFPNAINPDANHFNNYFTVYAGPEVRSVKSMRIYDRWGEWLFENKDFQPNVPKFGWDGRTRSHDVSPGVYVYVVELEFTDGTSETYSGDVTVIR